MDAKVNPNELIKANSNYLRGTLRESLADELTGALAPADAQISKFHGFYEQDDRDLRLDRRERLLEPEYAFIMRARLPGGVCTPDQVLAVAEAVVTTQRDLGDRYDRAHARLKYTVERVGLDAFRVEVEHRSGVGFQTTRPVEFTDHGDRFGWVDGADGRWHLTLYVENGRVQDQPGRTLMTGLRAVARVHQGDFRMTPNQNLILAGVPADQKPRIEALAREHGLLAAGRSRLRLRSIACVALPTCPQAMAEAERFGDFVIQAGIVRRVADAARDFHD